MSTGVKPGRGASGSTIRNIVGTLPTGTGKQRISMVVRVRVEQVELEIARAELLGRETVPALELGPVTGRVLVAEA